MNSHSAELASIAQELSTLDRQLDLLWWNASEPLRARLDIVYARHPFDPNLGPSLAALARTLEAEDAMREEDERAIEKARVS